MNHYFFSMLSRMKHVDRWGLMRNTWKENLSVHALEVATIAHALALLGNRRFGKQYDAEHIALLGMYHDASEIITGDLPTPVKYHSPEIVNAYKQVEEQACHTLLDLLPDDLKPDFEAILLPEDADEHRLVKAADKLSALIKCIEEESAGNREFIDAKQAQLTSLQAMGLPEVDCFLAEFIDGFGKTLDAQTKTSGKDR